MRKALMAGIAGTVLLQAAAFAVPVTTGAPKTGDAAVGRINNRLALGLASAQPPVACPAGQTCAPGAVEAGAVTSSGASHFPFVLVIGGVATVGGVAAALSSGGHGNPVSP